MAVALPSQSSWCAYEESLRDGPDEPSSRHPGIRQHQPPRPHHPGVPKQHLPRLHCRAGPAGEAGVPGAAPQGTRPGRGGGSRWGITEEESRQGKVLPISLAKINCCRPCFVGMLGEQEPCCRVLKAAYAVARSRLSNRRRTAWIACRASRSRFNASRLTLTVAPPPAEQRPRPLGNRDCGSSAP